MSVLEGLYLYADVPAEVGDMTIQYNKVHSLSTHLLPSSLFASQYYGSIMAVLLLQNICIM